MSYTQTIITQPSGLIVVSGILSLSNEKGGDKAFVLLYLLPGMKMILPATICLPAATLVLDPVMVWVEGLRLVLKRVKW